MSLPHAESHFTATDTVRDVVLGMSDGLTVPFALAAGLAGAAVSHWVVVTAGMAEVAAGTIAMGLGGYLAMKSEAESYEAEYRREWRETHELEAVERLEVRKIFEDYGLVDPGLSQAVDAVCANRDGWVRFMMREELGREKPEPGRAARSGLTIGLAYAAGGLVPLLPYFFLDSVRAALAWSAAVTLAALTLFGWVKGRLIGAPPARSALRTLAVGAIAAGVAFGLAALLGGAHG